MTIKKWEIAGIFELAKFQKDILLYSKIFVSLFAKCS